MINNSEIVQSLKEIKMVENNTSWFKDAPHRWAESSLPLAYAMACVEVVSQMSEKAGAIYHEIIEAWEQPGVKATYDKIIPEISDAEMEQALSKLSLSYRQALICKYVEEMAVSEISQTMGRSAKSVEGILTRAAKALRNFYDKASDRRCQ